MLKPIPKELWAFDAEWVPDPISGRLTYGCDGSWDDDRVVEEMWRQGGATPADPRPYLKVVLCRVVSIAVVIRKKRSDGSASVKLHSIPAPDERQLSEGALIDRFLGKLGSAKPQLVGYNSTAADFPILCQRAIVNRLRHPEFCHRPSERWDGNHYFGKYSDLHLDLKDLLSAWGKATPSLHEIATACGLPGKLGTDGSSVVELWRAGRVREIVQYNECDALTTYLLWLRTAHFAGRLTAEQFDAEEHQLAKYLEERGAEPACEHLQRYLVEWRRLDGIRRGGAAQYPTVPGAVRLKTQA